MPSLIIYICFMSNNRPWFKDWFNSPYYHQLYFKRDEAEAKKFINKLIEHLQPAKESFMLDIACGRGRHSRILAAMGFDVTGIDFAAESIKEAKKFETENLHFFVHDMRLPFWITSTTRLISLQALGILIRGENTRILLEPLHSL